jgi:hypothetical protein
MRLTSHFSRVAMPHFESCPHCHREVVDWFFEWYPADERKEIAEGRSAMDCPWCLKGVTLSRLKINQNPSRLAVPVLKRSRNEAEKWAHLLGYIDLEDFFEDPQEKPRAEPFLGKRYWTKTQRETEEEDGQKVPAYS